MVNKINAQAPWLTTSTRTAVHNLIHMTHIWCEAVLCWATHPPPLPSPRDRTMDQQTERTVKTLGYPWIITPLSGQWLPNMAPFHNSEVWPLFSPLSLCVCVSACITGVTRPWVMPKWVFPTKGWFCHFTVYLLSHRNLILSQVRLWTSLKKLIICIKYLHTMSCWL